MASETSWDGVCSTVSVVRVVMFIPACIALASGIRLGPAFFLMISSARRIGELIRKRIQLR